MKNIILAQFYDDKKKKCVKVSVSDYTKWISGDKPDKKEIIAYFIFNRLFSRYIKPYSFKNHEYKREFKNGFSIMANLCLLIETLQSFKNGWGDSRKNEKDAFDQFFKSDVNFAELKQKGIEFYNNIRCGILHQGETTGGWKITREGKKLYDSYTKTINAVIFAEKMEKSLRDYCDKLINSEWDSEVWDNFRVKMRRVIQNCQS